MIARLLISPSLEKRKKDLEKFLNLKKNHPDVLYIEAGEKLGIEQARQIKAHFSLKPYQAKGRVVVLEDASALTVEAQNALLKTLEELPPDAIFILGAKSDANLLPTVLSRCQIVRINNLPSATQPIPGMGYVDMEGFLKSSIEERFEYIEKCKDREKLLHDLVLYFRGQLPANKDYVKKLLQAEEWAAQNVNLRAILEYLMLVMPPKK